MRHKYYKVDIEDILEIINQLLKLHGSEFRIKVECWFDEVEATIVNKKRGVDTLRDL